MVLLPGEWYFWEGTRARLRAFEPRDVDTIALWDRDGESLRLGTLVGHPRSRESIEKRIAPPEGKPSADALYLAIETLDGQLAGDISTRHANFRLGTFEYGISVAREFRRHGLASEALKIVLRYMFDERRFLKAQAGVFSFNEPSQRFQEKFGFVLEGRLRQAWFTNGEQHDELRYGMTAAEFREALP